MSPEAAAANKALIHRYWREASARGIETVADEFLAPEVVSHPPTSASPAPLVGRDAYTRFVVAQFGALPDLSVTIEDAIAEGDKISVRVTARGTHTGELMGLPPTGRRVTFTGMEVFRITDGKIVEQWGQFDALGVLQQLGALPTPGQTDRA